MDEPSVPQHGVTLNIGGGFADRKSESDDWRRVS